jgi:hypothetical protein
MRRSSPASSAFRRSSAAARQKLEQGGHVTVYCAEGDTGFVYGGILDVEVLHSQLDKLPKVRSRSA